MLEGLNSIKECIYKKSDISNEKWRKQICQLNKTFLFKHKIWHSGLLCRLVVEVRPLDLIFLAIKYNPPATKEERERKKIHDRLSPGENNRPDWRSSRWGESVGSRVAPRIRGGGGCSGFARVPDAESTRKLAMIFDEQIRAGNPERQRGLAPFLKMVPPKGERDGQPEREKGDGRPR